MRAVATACLVATLCATGRAEAAGEEAPPEAAAPRESAPTESAEERDLDAVIAGILDVESVEEHDVAERCIARSRISRTEVLNERFVVFHLRGDEKYLVQFRHRCPGLRRNGTMRLETRSFRVCSMDTIQGLFEMGVGRGAWGPSCMIPSFEPVTGEQVAIIKEELRRSR